MQTTGGMSGAVESATLRRSCRVTEWAARQVPEQYPGYLDAASRSLSKTGSRNEDEKDTANEASEASENQ